MNTQPRKPHGPSAGTILCILTILAGWWGFTMMVNVNGGGSGAYSGQYQGPILPMTSISGGEVLEVQRHVDFDFAPYREPVEHPLSSNSVLVRDRYLLHNPTEQAVKAILAYPFEGQFIDDRDLIPTLTLDGKPLEAELYPAVDPREDIFAAKGFEPYQRLMTENDYLAQALETPKLENTPVKVYHFTDISYHGDSLEGDVFLTMDFHLTEGATAWVYRYNVMHMEEWQYSLWFQDTLDDQDLAWLVVMNGDVENLTFGGNMGHNVTETSGTEDVTCEYEVFDSTFLEMVHLFAQKYDHWEENPSYPNSGLVTTEILYRGAAALMAAQDRSSNRVYYMEDLFYQTVVNIRLMYWVFILDIPAGESVEVTAAYRQEASVDLSGAKKPREGYELATRLGSDLNFTALSASIHNGELVEILRQNFGFNLRKNITQVKLDLDTEKYYLEVIPKE